MRRFVYASVISILMAVALWTCGSSSTPSAPSNPTLTSLAVSGNTPAIGSSSQFTATANFSNGTNQNVTAQATWQSSSASVAIVSAAGLVTAVHSGESDIRATYQSLSGTLHISVAAAPRFTLLGVVSQTGSANPVVSAFVSVLDGANAGRSTTTDGNGYYSLGDLMPGSFTLEAFKTGYTTTDKSITLMTDLRFDFAMPTAGGGSPPPPAASPNQCTGPINAACGAATARCNDGTYSCSQNRRGTCSSHGGVFCWICPGKLC